MARDRIDVDPLRAQLPERWARLDVVAQTASTNADLLADDPGTGLRVLVAEHQSAGRGRLDRGWASPPGAGLLFSVRVRPPVPLARWGWLPLLAGVALAEAVEAEAGIAAGLKWPNDLLAPAGGKLAGILVQTAGDDAVIGIGLNVDTARDELPVDTATSLRLEGAGDVGRTDLLLAFLHAVDHRLTAWTDAGGDAAAAGLAADYRARCVTIGAAVRVQLGVADYVDGTAAGVDDAGRLVLDTATGELRVGAGDVTHVRRA